MESELLPGQEGLSKEIMKLLMGRGRERKVDITGLQQWKHSQVPARMEGKLYTGEDYKKVRLPGLPKDELRLRFRHRS